MALDVTTFYDAAEAAGMLSAASWTPAGGSATPVDVYFQNDAPDALGMEMGGPRCRVPKATVSTVAQGDAFTVAGANYVVTSIMADTPHFGESTLILRKSS